MSRLLQRTGRVARAVALTGAAVGLVWGAGQVDGGLDLARADDTPSLNREATPVSRTSLACPGADRPGVEGVADPEQTVTMITASAPERLVPRAAGDGAATATTLPGDTRVPGTVVDRGATRPIRVDGPAGVDLSAQGALAPGLSAVQVGVDRAASVKGLTMTPCTAPVATSYLLAGGAQAGQAERVVLTNPAPNPVPVTLSVLGTSGRQSVVVPSRSRKVVVLGSVDDSAKAPVVKVSAPRGAVTATMVEGTFAGAIARGTESVGTAREPERSQTVPLVHASENGSATVRVGVPGSADAIVRLSLVAPDGAAVPDDIVKTVSGRSSTDIDIPDLPPGDYAVRVTSDEPVVTAARSSQVADRKKASDLLWMPATAPLSGLGGVAVPKVPGGSAVLVLAAAGEKAAAATVTHVDDAGKTRTDKVSLRPDQTESVSVGKDAAVWVEPSQGSVSAAVAVAGKDGKQPLLSGVPVLPASVSTQDAGAQVRPGD